MPSLSAEPGTDPMADGGWIHLVLGENRVFRENWGGTACARPTACSVDLVAVTEQKIGSVSDCSILTDKSIALRNEPEAKTLKLTPTFSCIFICV